MFIAFVFKPNYFDLTGSLTYISLVIVALVLCLADAKSAAGAMVLLWAVRLGSLFARVSQAGEDR